MAKTQYSFSTDPNLRGAPEGHEVPIREVRLSAGAGFVVAICGEIMTMPGLPSVPSANSIKLDDNGLIEGLFCPSGFRNCDGEGVGDQSQPGNRSLLGPAATAEAAPPRGRR